MQLGAVVFIIPWKARNNNFQGIIEIIAPSCITLIILLLR
jgi:hypothetical protein